MKHLLKIFIYKKKQYLHLNIKNNIKKKKAIFKKAFCLSLSIENRIKPNNFDHFSITNESLNVLPFWYHYDFCCYLYQYDYLGKS